MLNRSTVQMCTGVGSYETLGSETLSCEALGSEGVRRETFGSEALRSEALGSEEVSDKNERGLLLISIFSITNYLFLLITFFLLNMIIVIVYSSSFPLF